MGKVIPVFAGPFVCLGTLGLLPGSIRKFQACVAASRVRSSRRAELRRLLRAGPHLIADIGLDVDAALAECAKAPWRD